LVDGFAGPGCFEDGTFGSPYYICKIASQVVPNKFLAILINKDKIHHQNLTVLLDEYIKNKSSITINGKAQEMLLQLSSFVSDETLFIYLDQFGISGFCFNDLLPFLFRDKHNSTELLLNISVPTIHRLSCKRTISSSNLNPLGHRILSQVFGGDYWKEYLFDENLSTQTQIFGLIEAYKSRLNQYLDYVGYCPIFEKGPKSVHSEIN
jgi:three-Cys-motif partner protein